MRGKDIIIGEVYSTGAHWRKTPIHITKIGGSRWAPPHGTAKNTAHGHHVNKDGEVNDAYTVYIPLAQVIELQSVRETRLADLETMKATRIVHQIAAVKVGQAQAEEVGLPIGDNNKVGVYISTRGSTEGSQPQYTIRAVGLYQIVTPSVKVAMEAYQRAVVVTEAIDYFKELEGN